MTVETDGGDATVALSANGTIEQAAAESTEIQESEGAQESVADSDVARESDVATAGEAGDSGDSGEDEADDAGDSGDAEEELIEEGEIAGDYLEQLLDVLDFDGDIDLDVEGDRAIVSIDGGRDLSKLVGRRGEVLDALQELTRLAVQQATGVRSRLMLDVAGWRAQRREELSALGASAAQRVLDSGKPESLAAMTPFERKIVHDAVAGVDGVESESEGVEPNRHVVVVPS